MTTVCVLFCHTPTRAAQHRDEDDFFQLIAIRCFYVFSRALHRSLVILTLVLVQRVMPIIGTKELKSKAVLILR